MPLAWCNLRARDTARSRDITAGGVLQLLRSYLEKGMGYFYGCGKQGSVCRFVCQSRPSAAVREGPQASA
jgi:hypothetical protein